MMFSIARAFLTESGWGAARSLGALLSILLLSSVTQASLLGIDVSRFQGTFSWTAVNNGGVDFGFAKATEGVNFIDNRFATNMTNARIAGMPIGPYHFGRPDSSVGTLADPVKQDAINEANDFVDAIQPYYNAYPGEYLRPVLDVEALPSTAEINTINEQKQYLSDWIRDFNSVVQSRLGLDVIIYANSNYANTYFESDLSSFDFWLARWTDNTNVKPTQANLGIFNEWDFWQWTDNWSVGGLSPVDGDYFEGDLNDLEAFVVGGEVGLVGDYNGDGTVNAADYTVWKDSWLQFGEDLPADGDNDGFVGNSDYTVWIDHFGETNLSTSTAIPEPATWLLLGAGLTSLAFRRRPIAMKGPLCGPSIDVKRLGRSAQRTLREIEQVKQESSMTNFQIGFLCPVGWSHRVATVLFLAIGLLMPNIAGAGLLGVDVSKWQSNVNWTAVKQDGISFGFAKATEGVNFVDAQFHNNMTNARNAGVPIGPYHFARPDSSVGTLADPIKQDAINEANDFVDAIEPYYNAHPGSYLRPVLDLEKTPETEEINTLSEQKQYLSDWTRDFNSVVQSRLGLDVILYTGGWRANNLYESDISSLDLWFAKPTDDLNSQPTPSNLGIWNDWKFWQWSWEADYGGVSPVDANYFDGDLNDLQAYIVGGEVELLGDYNGDGTVDAADYTVWQDSWLQLGEDLPADGDNDGFVGNSDYTIWADHFGETNLSTSTAVPEPTTWLLLGAGLTSLAFRRRQ